MLISTLQHYLGSDGKKLVGKTRESITNGPAHAKLCMFRQRNEKKNEKEGRKIYNLQSYSQIKGKVRSIGTFVLFIVQRSTFLVILYDVCIMLICVLYILCYIVVSYLLRVIHRKLFCNKELNLNKIIENKICFIKKRR